jgi:hypothetical protein
MWPEQAYQSPEVNRPGQRLLEAEQQGLVAGVEIRDAHLRVHLGSIPMAAHEIERLG